MQTGSERRKFPRLTSDFGIVFRTSWPFDVIATGHSAFFLEVADHELQGVATNISYREGWMGGVFMTMDAPLPRGTVLDLRFWLNNRHRTTADPLEAPPPGNLVDSFQGVWSCRAVVRWRRQWDTPRGVGLVFTEVDHKHHGDMAHLAKQAAQDLTDRQGEEGTSDPLATQMIQIPQPPRD